MMKNNLRAQLLRHLKAQTHLLKKQLLNVHRHPTKKNVHQLRIAIRRIRAALWIVEHGTPQLSFKKLHSDLRKLSRALGQLRELHVAVQDANEYHVKIKKMKKKHRKAQGTLLEKTNSKHRKKIVASLNKAILKMQSHQEQTLASGTALLRKRILPWTQKTLITENDFHKLRIITKKTRYILEAIGKPAQPLHELQDVLGKGHDLQILQDFAKKTPQIRDATKAQYLRALPMVQPTLHFAVKKLSLIS